MDLERVTCGSCGASLDVPESADYVNCRHCGSSLHVQRTDSVVFTEVVNTLKQHSERLAENTEMLRLQNELELLDQEWQNESAGLMIRDKHGHQSIPGKTSSAVGAVFIVLFGLFWTIMAGAMFPPMALFGILFIGFGIYTTSRAYAMAGRYESLKDLHDEKRAKILTRLRTLRPGEGSETSSFEG